jgi:hypothetical protein
LSECESWVIFGVLSLLEHTHPKLPFGFCTCYTSARMENVPCFIKEILSIPCDTIPICAKSRNAIPFFAAHSSKPDLPLPISSPKRRRHRIPHHQLLPLLKTLSQSHVSPNSSHKPQLQNSPSTNSPRPHPAPAQKHSRHNKIHSHAPSHPACGARSAQSFRSAGLSRV